MGGIVKTVGAIRQGKAAKAAADFQAEQLEAAGLAEQATASVRAGQEKDNAKLVSSRARAVGAAGGGGLDLELMGDIEAEGQYRSLTALWEGEEARKGRDLQAKAARVEGKNAQTAGYINAAASLIETGESLYDKYG